MKGKPWTSDEEAQLRELIRANKSVRVIAKTIGKTRKCIRMKIARLSFDREVVIAPSKRTTTSDLPVELPSVEEVLKKLAAALDALEQPNLEQSETLRLRSIVQSVKVYKELLADFVDYRGIEAKVVELEAKYAKFLEDKTKNN